LKTKDFFNYLLKEWGIESQNPIYLKAIQHKSIDPSYNNERLELLGDTVLEMVVTDELFHTLTEENEGRISQVRARIVSRKTLNAIGDKIGLRSYIQCVDQLRDNIDLSGNVFEAMCGAVYLDQPYEKVKECLIDILKTYADWKGLCKDYKNPKTLIHEWAQRQKLDLDFKLITQSIKGGKQNFKIALVIDGKEIIVKDGFNKRQLESELAEDYMKNHAMK